MSKVYEMQIHKSEFVPFAYNDSFKVVAINKFEEGKEHFKEFIKSIDVNLSDWDNRPTLEDVKERLNGVSKCSLFFHKD